MSIFLSQFLNDLPQMLAVMFDQELYTLFNDGKVIMPGTGVAPFIHKASPAGGQFFLRGEDPFILIVWLQELLPKNPHLDEPVGKKPKTAAEGATTKPQDKVVATASLKSPPQSPKSCHSQEF